MKDIKEYTFPWNKHAVRNVEIIASNFFVAWALPLALTSSLYLCPTYDLAFMLLLCIYVSFLSISWTASPVSLLVLFCYSLLPVFRLRSNLIYIHLAVVWYLPYSLFPALFFSCSLMFFIFQFTRNVFFMTLSIFILLTYS